MTHPLFFSSSDFTDESEAVLLIGLLTEFRRILAAGQWLTPYICSCCFFLSRRFRRWRRFFFVGLFLSHRFTQIYTDFFHRKVFHRISRMNRKAFLLIGLLTDFRRYLAAGQWLAPDMCCFVFGHADFADDADFSSCDYFCPTDFTDIHRFFWISGESLCPISGGICNDRTGRLREIPWVIAATRNLRINFVSSDDEKICVICEICVT